ncbi:hypothetical protein CAEBREN_23355 [Caenorhabditis brenneri]|uniref:Uncharacterized protein n=1 Tax=Caenorhabditis brenneri TaxID=135651 RepID=G0P0F2_CAEBE|nr:hypothetical protein CAEBREN_23355 [Caenorhabditis brenneri]
MKLVILCLILALPVISCQTTSRPSFGGGSILESFSQIGKELALRIGSAVHSLLNHVFGILEVVLGIPITAFRFFNNGVSGIFDFLGLGHLRLGGLIGGLAGGARIPSNDAAETVIASELEAKTVEAIPKFVLRGQRQLDKKRVADWIRDPP